MNRLSKKDEKRKMRFQPEPLCLFYFPEEVSLLPPVKKTYVKTLPGKEEPEMKQTRRKRWKDKNSQRQGESKDKGESWRKKINEQRLIRRRMREPIRHLKSYLLASVNYEDILKKTDVPSLYEVLETVKDAWPTPPRRNFSFHRQDDPKCSLIRGKMILSKGKMKEEMYLQFPSPLINRRFSMPEELMRKYFIMKEKTSEESETNKTMNEMTTSSSTTTTASTVEETTRERPPPRTQNPDSDKSEKKNNTITLTVTTEEETLNPQNMQPARRVTQAEYYSQGKSVIKVKESGTKSSQVDACICRSEKVSSNTTLSAKNETDESGTTESGTSSSPVQLPKQESPTDLLSSESDQVPCTCREITSSKETSTDVFHSGKSTLSQTVSDKSMSTQDSTISLRSVSTRGSTATDNSNTTTPDVDKTSAKETTTSDNTPRTPRTNINRKNGRCFHCCHHEQHKKTCPRYLEVKHSCHIEHAAHCPLHCNHLNHHFVSRKSCGTNTDISADDYCTESNYADRDEDPLTFEQGELEEDEETDDVYTWAKLSHDELYMMQQLRHQKLMESHFSSIHDHESETCDTITLECDTETDNLEQSIMIPRYSALPRSLSMLVNTSSPENSLQNSDSDNQSLADSLEDQPTTHAHKFYFDTKKETKPVRGDVNAVEDKVQRVNVVPKGKAFFVSMKDPFGEDKLLEGIEKIPEPPEKVRNHIDERHLNLNNKHKHSHETFEHKMAQKKRKTRNIRKEDSERTGRIQKAYHKKKDPSREGGKKKFHDKKAKSKKETSNEQQTKLLEHDSKEQIGHFKEPETDTAKKTSKRKKENKGTRERLSSKIPVLVSSRSNSSPEGDEGNKKHQEKTGGDSQVVETTQILEITKTDKGMSLQPPHTSVVHQTPVILDEADKQTNKNNLLMPPIKHNTRMQPPYRLPLNRTMLLSQSGRSPVTRYRQRFEVIPEEKSSSLSSTEDKSAKDTLPKFTTTGTSPLPPKEDSKPENTVRFESFSISDVPNLIMAQVGDKQLKTLPYLKGADEQKIILFSSKPQNSTSIKGRDALIAMNREDFNRLAKGWMNFYKLRENADFSDSENKKKDTKSIKEKELNESVSVEDTKKSFKSVGEIHESNLTDDQINNNLEKTENEKNSYFQTTRKGQQDEILTSKKGTGNKKSLQPNIDEKIRFHSSNTILRTVKTISPSNTTKMATKRSSLPDLYRPTEKIAEPLESRPSTNTLPSVIKRTDYSDEDSDSDSTDYMEPPSPRVPPLPLEDLPSDATISSSDNELDDSRSHTTANPVNFYQLKKWGGTNRSRLKKEPRTSKKNNSGWSVTVAGTVELSRSAPDLEMRLSFPVNGGPPVVCQSDSGFAEDSNYSKISDPVRDFGKKSARKDLSVHSGNSKQKWTVTVQKPNQGNGNQNQAKSKTPKNMNHLLPDLESPRNSKKVLKKSLRKLIARKLYAIWPRVQKVIQEEFDTDDYMLMTEFSEGLNEDGLLSVRGTAISLEKKEKPLTMTQRDITRRYTSRETGRTS